MKIAVLFQIGLLLMVCSADKETRTESRQNWIQPEHVNAKLRRFHRMPNHLQLFL
jgi:hypothetical protein